MFTVTVEQRSGSAATTERWRSLAKLAYAGLRAMYGSTSCRLPHTCRWNGDRGWATGHNPRYALISILGLAKGRDLVDPDGRLADTLWSRVLRASAQWKAGAGDYGLGLWCASVLRGDAGPFTVGNALAALRRHAPANDSVDLAWLLLGAEHALTASHDDPEARALVEASKAALMPLFSSESGLFYRHAGGAPGGAFTRRVPCFANQIYPILALALHAQRTECAESRRVLEAVASTICRYQGPQGQWCWLYDARDGGVIDAYPVFSVHQDGMAPMALMEAGRALDRSFTEPIGRGLAWIYGANELRQSLVLPDEGLILRDIHPRGVERVRRAIHAYLACRGWRRRADSWTEPRKFIVNQECRPYHLGWIVYAASLACQDAGLRDAN